MSLEHARPDRHGISLADRLDHGKLTLAEVGALAQKGKTAIYQDIKDGKLLIEKHGRSTRVSGPIARLYIDGKNMPPDAA